MKKKRVIPAQGAVLFVAAEKPEWAPLTTYDREMYDYVPKSRNVWYGLPIWCSMMHTGTQHRLPKCS